MKKLLFIIVTILLAMAFLTVHADAGINILLNGKTVIFDDNTGYPYVDENNRTMVPLRATMESAGFVVGYDNNAQTAIIITEYNRIEVPVGTNKVYVNNTLKENDTIAVIQNDRIYLPIRMILEIADYTVEWDSSTKTVNAYTYAYDEENFEPYHTTDISTLLEKLLSGQVVYIDGQYYATPEYVKLLNNVQMYYSGDDLNTAIYPQKDKFLWADIPSFPVKENNIDIDGIE